MEKTLLEFVTLEAEFKALEEKRTALREKIVKTLEDKGIEKFEEPTLGSFKVAHRITYNYSDAVAKLQEKVKIAKTKEEQKGVAEVKSDTSYLVYSEPKK